MANACIVIVLLLHVAFLVLEMFLWNTPTGMGIFKTALPFAKESAPLAMNQGLYNGFLAAGLLWGLVAKNAETAHQAKLFFLACVVVAGVFGAFTVNLRIFFVQALPAIVAIVALLYTQK